MTTIFSITCTITVDSNALIGQVNNGEHRNFAIIYSALLIFTFGQNQFSFFFIFILKIFILGYNSVKKNSNCFPIVPAKEKNQ